MHEGHAHADAMYHVICVWRPDAGLGWEHMSDERQMAWIFGILRTPGFWFGERHSWHHMVHGSMHANIDGCSTPCMQSPDLRLIAEVQELRYEYGAGVCGWLILPAALLANKATLILGLRSTIVIAPVVATPVVISLTTTTASTTTVISAIASTPTVVPGASIIIIFSPWSITHF